MSDTHIYKVIFRNQDQVVELYARQVSQGALFGFVEIEELVFGTRSQVVVDPSEESLKAEFAGVKRTYLPLHAVIRIDEVEREGSARIRDRKKGEGSAVHPFPVPIPTPGNDPGGR